MKLNKVNTDEENRYYVPDFFRLSQKEDREAFSSLLQHNNRIRIYDCLTEQVGELVKAQNPDITYSAGELQKAVHSHLGSIPPDEYGVWVFYPWSDRLVHILDEEEFILVRTNRNHNKITPKEGGVLSKKRVGVMGLSVGQSVALTMAMERSFGEIRLADFDSLELSNLNRIRTGVHHLGLSKTTSVAREIAEIDPYLKVTCFHEGITEGNLDDFLLGNGKLDVLIDVCDSLDMKVLARQRAKKYRIPVVMDTSDRGMVDVERFDLEPLRPVLHGLIDHLDLSALKHAKTNEEKVPYALAIVGVDSVSDRMKTSMQEIGRTILTWPQLSSDVVMGGGIAANVCRRIFLDQFRDSGRYYVDVDEIISERATAG